MQRYTIFFITVNALCVSGGSSAHHQELKNCTHSIGCMPRLLAATARSSSKQAWHTPDAVCTVFEHLMMCKGTAWNVYSTDNNKEYCITLLLRRIYGPICEEAVWRSRYNEELYRLYDEADLVTTIKISRLRWAGHVMRMQDNLPCKKITLDKPEGRRWAGRPNLRWIDGVMKDAEKVGVRNWRARARDRDDWRRLLESAKTLRGM